MDQGTTFATKSSSRGFAPTLDALVEVLESSGNTVFARIDQAAEAAKVGAALRPTTLLLFGNPRVGTPLMSAVPTLALDLPLKALVWEDDFGRVQVSFNVMRTLAARFGEAGVADALDAMDAKLAALIERAIR